METISISRLKAHLSEELKKVQTGTSLTILDHQRPVAVLTACAVEDFLVKEASEPYRIMPLAPLTTIDPLDALNDERKDPW